MKTLPSLTALLFALTLTACGGGSGGSSAPAPTPAPAPVAPTPTPTLAPDTSLYPSYNTNPLPADATGMSSSAVQLAAKLKLGWNLGNTLEAIGASGETSWGNPKVTPQLIQAVKQAGFNAIRLPTSWNQYADQTTGKISDAWLSRVKDVVQYCVDNDMYVLINIHWDGGWLDENINTAKQAAVNAKQKAFWEQIATKLRDYDEHVMFASANEPPAKDAAQMAILLSYHQTFINAVRATGGRNAYRTLVVQGPGTAIDLTSQLMTTMPTDTLNGRLMAEVHYYDPSQFALLTQDASWGKMAYFWGSGFHSTTDPDHNASWGEESWADAEFALMKAKFVDKGIPVLVGEFGAIRRTTLSGADLTLHLDSRAYFLNYVTRKMVANGLVPFYWDEGAIGNNGFGIINRANNTVSDQRALDAIVNGAKGL